MKKYLGIGFTLLLALGIIISFYFAANRTWHDPNTWMTEHPKTYNRLKKTDLERKTDMLNKECLGCHEKKYKQTKANFCNKCHQERGVKPVQ